MNNVNLDFYFYLSDGFVLIFATSTMLGELAKIHAKTSQKTQTLP